MFVVHGRELKLRDSVFAFLRAIGLSPLNFSIAASSIGKASPYVGEILDAAFHQAQAIVVLLTPDDEAKLRDTLRTIEDPPHETRLTPQARPNVLFEAGMAIGRNPDRTVLVEVGALRPFSDIAGRHTVRLNNSSPRRQEFAQRLQAAGCPVDLSSTEWHSVGDFAVDSLEMDATATDIVGAHRPFAGTDDDHRVLNTISDSKECPTLAALEFFLDYSEQRVLYHLERLEEHNLIARSDTPEEPTVWLVTKKGRAYIFENRLQ